MTAHPLDGFIPRPDARERFAVTVDAPAAVVFRVASEFDMQSVSLVRGIFRLRTILMRGAATPRVPRPLLEDARAMGWGALVERPGALFVAGAVCQPWRAQVTFRAIPPEQFAAFAEPDLVKIAWTLETSALGPSRTHLATETRAVATDPAAQTKFLRYWRWARFGILPIRWVLLPAIGRRARAEWRAGRRVDPC